MAIPPSALAPIRCLRSQCLRKAPSKSTIDRRRYISAYGYTQAKSLVYSKHGNPRDVLDLHTHSLSPPHSNLLTLRTLAAPLNPADINQIQGTYPTVPPFTSALGTAQPSAIPGNEACFEVLSAGSGASSVQKGDWVIARHTGLGTWRTHLQVPEDKVTKVDNREGVTAKQVGTVSVNPVTAYRMLKDFVPLQEGDWYIQNGANSGVGRAALQLGRKWGLKCIAVIRGREGQHGEEAALKAEMTSLGADKVITDTELMQKGIKDQVAEWTHGGRAHVKLALNCVGGDAAMAMAKLLSPGASMVTYGAMSKLPLRVGASSLIFKDLRFCGFWVSRWADANPAEKKRTVDEILEMYRGGELKDVPTIDVQWDWDTERETLVEAVGGTLEGFRKGKGVFVFGDT